MVDFNLVNVCWTVLNRVKIIVRYSLCNNFPSAAKVLMLQVEISQLRNFTSQISQLRNFTSQISQLHFATFCSDTAQEVKFCFKDFFSKCDQIRSFLRIWSCLLKSPIENFIFCAVLKVKTALQISNFEKLIRTLLNIKIILLDKCKSCSFVEYRSSVGEGH